MRDYMNIGSSPCDEPCAQVGEPHKGNPDSGPEPEMGVWCAWCDQHLAGPIETEAKSHGICQECMEAVLDDYYGRPPRAS